MTRRLMLGIPFLCALVVLSPAAQEASEALADRARDKIDSIIALGEGRRNRRARPVSTELTELEINAYLSVHGPQVLPPGIANPGIRLGENGRIRARAIVDLTEVRKAKARTWRDPLAYVTGSVEVIASGRVDAADGIGRAYLESAMIAGVSIPNAAVQELVRFYTSSADHPEGFDLDEPFALPVNIREVTVEHGRAAIVQ